MTCFYYWLLAREGTRWRSLGKFNTTEQVAAFVRLHRLTPPLAVTFAATRAAALEHLMTDEAIPISPRPGARSDERV